MSPIKVTDDPAEVAPRLTNEQIVELMRLVKGSTSVELKVTVPASAHRATIRGLPIDPVEAQPRQVFFFDTPDLALNRAGVVVRARRIQGGRGDTVVKLRPVEPDSMPLELRKDPAFKIEVDVIPGGFVCSASLRGRSTGREVRDVTAGKLALSKVFTKDQRAFYSRHAPAGIDLDSLSVLGPIFVLKGRFEANTGLHEDAAPRLIVAEMWLYPDGERIFELSTKCPPAETIGAAAETRAYLENRGIPVVGAQQTKTSAALAFFSAELTAGAPAKAAPAKRSVPAAKRTPASNSRRSTATRKPATRSARSTTPKS
jgi:hypothetical protein